MEFQPAWLTEELNRLLDGVGGGPYHRLRRNTVLHLAEARATGGLDKDVWARPDCCSRKTWEGKHRRDAEGASVKHPGWKEDPAIQAALEAAVRRANWWQDQAEARRIAKRQEDVARARDKLCELAWAAVLKLGAILGTDNADTARKAANDILNRADEALASKAKIYEMGENVQHVRFDLDGLPVELLRLLADPGDSERAAGGGEGGTE